MSRSLSFFITSILGVLILSCSKESLRNSSNEEFVRIKPSNVTLDVLKDINRDFKKLYLNATKDKTISKRTITPLTTDDYINSEVQSIAAPLIESGTQIYTDILEQLTNSREWYSLPEEDKTTIRNFSDGQLIQLALIFTSDNDPTVSSMSFRACVGVALGLNGIKDVINLSGLYSAKTAVQLLKTIGKRYLGYVGIVWMVWDFTDCISSIDIKKATTDEPVVMPKPTQSGYTDGIIQY